MTLGWSGGSVYNDPKQIWHSKSAAGGGSNFISYSNPKVDKLIDAARLITDLEKRKKMFYQIYEEIAEDAPYAFMFNEKYSLYAANKRINRPKDTHVYDVGSSFWSLTK